MPKKTKAASVRADVQIYWHPEGDYVAVQVERYTQIRKSTYTSLQLFTVKLLTRCVTAVHL